MMSYLSQHLLRVEGWIEATILESPNLNKLHLTGVVNSGNKEELNRHTVLQSKIASPSIILFTHINHNLHVNGLCCEFQLLYTYTFHTVGALIMHPF